MAVAALDLEFTESSNRIANDGAVPVGPLRCLILDDSRFDRKFLCSVARESKFEFDFVEASTIVEAEQHLERERADLALIDYRIPDGDGIEFATKLIGNADYAAMPVILITGEGSESTAVRALRSGVTDYLNKDEITTEALDNAIENSLQRLALRLAPGGVHLAQAISENQALRRVSMRNMRLLKGQTLPLLAYTGSLLAQNGAPSEADALRQKRLAKIARNIVNLIDDTVIHAATYKVVANAEKVDLKQLVDDIVGDEAGEVNASQAHVTVGALPTMIADRSKLSMLFEELLSNGVRSGGIGQIPEIAIASSRDPQGNPIITFEERADNPSSQKIPVKLGDNDLSSPDLDVRADPYAWSLCQRLVEQNHGEFRIARNSPGSIRIMMRFPKHMIA